MVFVETIRGRMPDWLVRAGVDIATPVLTYEEVEGEVSLGEANRLDKEEKWEKAASVFNAVVEKGEDPVERAEAFIGRCQMLINLGCLGQARRDLERGFEGMTEGLEPDDEFYFRGRMKEKQAWIADYVGNFGEEAKLLAEARDWVTRIPEEGRGERGEDLLSTVTHFLGRAHYGLARQGKDVLVNVVDAIGCFAEDLRRFEGMREEGKPEWANEGFQYAWLARCYLQLVRLEGMKKWGKVVEGEIEQIKACWEKYLAEQPKSSIMGHYHLIRGEWEMENGQYATAIGEFEMALKVWEKGEEYRRGMARALLGVAGSWVAEGSWAAALKYWVEAVKCDKTVWLRPF